MNRPLSSSSDLSMRKDLVRLRMEMHRQQLLYHAQPLAQPISHLQGMFAGRGKSPEHRSRKHPLMIATMVAFALFGRRLGAVGKIARTGLALYPILRKLR